MAQTVDAKSVKDFIATELKGSSYSSYENLKLGGVLRLLSHDDLLRYCFHVKLDGVAGKSKEDLVTMLLSRKKQKKRKAVDTPSGAPDTKKQKQTNTLAALTEMTLLDLKTLAKSLGLTGYSTLKKEDLVRTILISPPDKGELEKKTLLQLKTIAKQLCIKGVANKNLADVKEAILKRHLTEQPPAVPSTPPPPKKEIPKPAPPPPAVSQAASSAVAASTSAAAATAHVHVHINHLPAPAPAPPTTAPAPVTRYHVDNKPVFFPELVRHWKNIFSLPVGREIGRLLELKGKAEQNNRSPHAKDIIKWIDIVIGECNKVLQATHRDFEWLFSMNRHAEFNIMAATEDLYNSVAAHLYAYPRDALLVDPLLFLLMTRWSEPKRQ